MIAVGVGFSVAGLGAAIVALVLRRQRRRRVITLVWDPAERRWSEARGRAGVR